MEMGRRGREMGRGRRREGEGRGGKKREGEYTCIILHVILLYA